MKSALWTSMFAAALLTTARPAAACETDSPQVGLALEIDDFEGHPVAEGGALLMRAEAYAVDIDTALADLVLWEVRRDGVVQPGSFEVVPLWDAPATSVSGEHHVFALTWRPDAPFTADGVYTVDFEVAGRHGVGPQKAPLAVVAAAAPGVPLVVPYPTTEAVDTSEVVCCEIGVDSCGTGTHCEATRASLLPAFRLDLELGIHLESQILWVARVLPGGEIGPRLQGQTAYTAAPWSWFGTVSFDVPAEQYCVIVGVTSMIDGSEVVSDPQCMNRSQLGVPHKAEIAPSPEMDPYDPAAFGVSSSGRCIGPIVYEADGAAYPRGSGEPAEPEEPVTHGCNVAGDGAASGAWLVLLALIRRRRARA